MTPKPNHLLVAALALTLPGTIALIGLMATGRLAPGPGIITIVIIAAGNAALLFRPLTRLRRLANRLETLIDMPPEQPAVAGPTDEAGAIGETTFYRDEDGDGLGQVRQRREAAPAHGPERGAQAGQQPGGGAR